MMALSTYNKKEDGVKMSVHVDDPLVIGPEGPIRVLFDWLGMRIAVKGLETFDSARGLKYLGMVYNTIPAGFLETTLAGYIEGMASMMGVMHAKTPTTPGFRTPHPTEADEKRLDAARQRVFRAIVGKTHWILRARPGVLYAVKELSRRLQKPRRPRVSQEDGEVPPRTRDIALELRPRKGPLRWAAPQTASSGAMVWLIGALASSLFGHEGSSPCRHQKQSAARAQWESPKQRSLSPLSSTGESPQRSSISLTTVA